MGIGDIYGGESVCVCLRLALYPLDYCMAKEGAWSVYKSEIGCWQRHFHHSMESFMKTMSGACFRDFFIGRVYIRVV